MNVLVWVVFHAFILFRLLLYDPEYFYTILNTLIRSQTLSSEMSTETLPSHRAFNMQVCLF